VRTAAALSGAGLLVQLGASLHWTPASFVLSATVGVPLVLAGAVQFVRVVLRVMRDKGAL
jgi:hypothetical protein